MIIFDKIQEVGVSTSTIYVYVYFIENGRDVSETKGLSRISGWSIV